MITCGVAEMLSIIAVILLKKALSNPNGSELFSAFNGLIKKHQTTQNIFFCLL